MKKLLESPNILNMLW